MKPAARPMKVRSLALAIASLVLSAPSWAQESLPFAEKASGSKAGPTIAQSQYSPLPAASHLPANAPNIVVIMLDDVGPALPGTFGGVIDTPTLTRLAGEGVSYNRFHNAAMCSPSRAALLTGRNHHRVGNGQIAELANDWDGYTGRIPRTSATVAKVLGYYGYATAAFGKWHNTPANETTAVGPYTNWPAGEGIGSGITGGAEATAAVSTPATTGGSGRATGAESAGRIDSTSTSPLPFCAMPRRCAAAYERSMTRPCRNGPRSLTRTTTLRPLDVLVTRAYEGSGSVGCAAVIANMS